jgi:hypothetical protein
MKPLEVKKNLKSKRWIKLYRDNGAPLRAKTTRLIFATMTGTDVAIYELALTYRELQAQGIFPLELDLEPPRIGESVSVISRRKMQSFNCHIENITDTNEGGYLFSNSLRLSSDCQQTNGTSGSPIISQMTGLVVGIANSYNKDGKACTNHNPCEINFDTKVIKGARYGQQLTSVWELISL